MQRLLQSGTGFECRHDQVEFAIAVQVVAHSTAAILFERHAHQVAGFDETPSGLVEKEPVFLEAAVGFTGAQVLGLHRTKVKRQHRIVLRRARVDIMPPKLRFVIARRFTADVAMDDVKVQVAVVVEVAGSRAL